MNYDVTPKIDDEAENRIDALPDQLSGAEKRSLITLALDVLADLHRPGEALTSPDATQAYLRLRLGENKAEANRHLMTASSSTPDQRPKRPVSAGR